MARKRSPNGLQAAGRRLWRDITAVYDLRADELVVLESVCREADLIALLQATIDDPDFNTYSKGSMGQVVINPVISEIRQHRATMQRLIASLKLPDEPTGEAGSDVSNKARQAASARWSRSG